MHNIPSSERISIVISGLRNSGKSSLMNNIFEKEISIVSDTPGTTTDPVNRNIELKTLGAVTIWDTAGFDDIGDLGSLRIKKALDRFENAQIIILTTRIDEDFRKEELNFLERIKASGKQVVIALTFCDKTQNENKLRELKEYRNVSINNLDKSGIPELKKILIELKNNIECEITPVEGLIKENDLVILVTPIDLAAPKARLILPQVETIRDILDKDCASLVVKERELKFFYDSLTIKPRLVITDSQVFSKVAGDIPQDQPLTSFSILFARKKGDLVYFIRGIKKLKDTPKNCKILILESCSHHRQGDDIGTVKIPRLFKQMVQPLASFDFAREMPEPNKLKEYFMVINCAGCMITRTAMMNRISILKKNGIHAVNYGLFLAWSNGLLPRALEPFPYEYELYNS